MVETIKIITDNAHRMSVCFSVLPPCVRCGGECGKRH